MGSLLAVLVGTTLLGLGAMLTLLLLHLSPQSHSLPVTAEWIDELSIDRYRPMLRLLDENDMEFLRTQPGFHPGLEYHLRAQRCRIFRGYLKSLDADFDRTCLALKLVMLHSNCDRPDLARALIRARMSFTSAKLAVQLRMALFYVGLGSVDVRGLVSLFDSVRLELRALIPFAEGAKL